VKQVGREPGVRYVLEGSVRKAGGRVRITAQLIDALSGTHLWADRFDGSLEDVFDLQDKVASSVAGVIEPALQAAETARSADRPTNDLTAYDLYLRACALELSLAPEALRLLDQAIGRDPHYGPALALAAHFHAQRCIAGWSEDPEADSRHGADLARRALQVARDNPGTIVDAALALAFFGEDIGAMMALVDRALALNPSPVAGTIVVFSVCSPGNPNERSSMPRPRCVLARAVASARRSASSAPRAWSAAASTRRCQSSCWRSKRLRAFLSLIAGSPHASPIWGGLMKRAMSSGGCAPSLLLLFRPPPSSEIRNIESCYYPVCA
jgi:hypothetical protein